jgi:hypothetical protein
MRRSTTNTRSMRGTLASASMEWNIIGLPRWGGTAWERRRRCGALPAASTRRRSLA